MLIATALENAVAIMDEVPSLASKFEIGGARTFQQPNEQSFALSVNDLGRCTLVSRLGICPLGLSLELHGIFLTRVLECTG